MPHKPSHCSGGGNFATRTPNKTCRIIPIKAWWFKGEKCWLISQCYKPVAVVIDFLFPFGNEMRTFKEVLLLGKNKMLCCLVFLWNSTITLLLLFP